MKKSNRKNKQVEVAAQVEVQAAPKYNAMIFDAPNQMQTDTQAADANFAAIADQSAVTEQQAAIVAEMMQAAPLSAEDVAAIASLEPEVEATAPASVPTEAKQEIAESDVIAAHAAMLNALNARIADAPNANQVEFFVRMREKHLSIHESRALLTHGVDVSALAAMLGNSNKNDSARFVAKYALEKVLKVARALAQNSFSQLDKYTQSIALNVRALELSENKQKIRAQTALACLSSAITFDENDIQQAYKRYGQCVASTASTQRSSTREALRALGAADASKNVRDDSFTFTDAPIADALRTLCDNAIAK